ncbi:uncharacterized protein CLAFUR5_13630 [Fulvia fulva]|uniref:Transmembrane protein n=1 Tax=Passalora fulva TaxID=5499 RepID=A0A9Q8PL77_PASFU|nr:uncharacterized protein CLAFUR5_13630 [Fulvia fulva]UJO24659.1 hypothetical protein CLAFUR5_13630 [Fulvia fulva]WPV36989.1 hypothetical protein CLAFUW7_13792 [Fulvia fulva]
MYETWDISSTWTLELLSAGLSVASLAALAGVLAYADGRELVAWYNLTLNTVISILSTISRLCAIFVLCESIAQVKWAIFAENARSLLDFEAIDAASRGPVGAFWLLWRGKRVAMVGAVAMLLALVFDPSAQQLVRWRTAVEFEASEVARLPRAVRYGRGIGLWRVRWWGWVVMMGSNDLSKDLQRSESTGQSTSVLMDTSNSGSMFGNVVKLELLNQLSIDNYESVAPELLFTSWGTGNESGTVSMSDIDTLIWSMAILRVKPKDQGETRTWPHVDLEESECALYYCVKRYNESDMNNSLSHSWTEVTTATRSQDSYSWQPSQSSIDQYQAELNDADIESLAFDDSLSAVERTDLQLGDVFNISQAAVNGLSSFFQSTFAAKNISNVNNTNGFYMRSSANTQYQPAAIQPLVLSVNLDATFTALAESMSNPIRTADDNAITDFGMMGTSVTRYRVHWPWITLPILVVLASVGQLVITIRASGDAPLWNNSVLCSNSDRSRSRRSYETLRVVENQWDNQSLLAQFLHSLASFAGVDTNAYILAQNGI